MRVALYLRVSSEEQVQGYSLDAEERAGRAYCAAHGWSVAHIYTDEGRSARADDLATRPDFARMLAAAEAGLLDVVVVHKLDRFARNRRLAFNAFHRLGTAGVGFVSIAENMDYSTPAGQFMLTMLVGMAQFYSDNLSFETKKGKHERKAQGLHNGLLPFGVTAEQRDLPVLDREARACDVATRRDVVPGDGLVLAFELAAAGKTDREIARALTAAGYRTSGNRGANPFTKDTVRVILRNRFYVGELPDGSGGWVPGKHGALIDPALFERAQRARDVNRKRPRRAGGRRSPWGLSGVATCAQCGESIIIHGRPDGRSRLRCAGRAQGNGCDQPSLFADEAEDQVARFLAGFAVPAAAQERFVTAWRRRQSAAVDTVAARLRLHRKLDRLKDLYLDGGIEKAEYQARKAPVLEELAILPAEGNPDEGLGRRLAGFLANLASAWQAATPEERNRLARQLFTQAVVENKTVVAVVPRPELAPFFDLVSVKGVTAEATGFRFALASSRQGP